MLFYEESDESLVHRAPIQRHASSSSAIPHYRPSRHQAAAHHYSDYDYEHYDDNYPSGESNLSYDRTDSARYHRSSVETSHRDESHRFGSNHEFRYQQKPATTNREYLSFQSSKSYDSYPQSAWMKRSNIAPRFSDECYAPRPSSLRSNPNASKYEIRDGMLVWPVTYRTAPRKDPIDHGYHPDHAPTREYDLSTQPVRYSSYPPTRARSPTHASASNAPVNRKLSHDYADDRTTVASTNDRASYAQSRSSVANPHSARAPVSPTYGPSTSSPRTDPPPTAYRPTPTIRQPLSIVQPTPTPARDSYLPAPLTRELAVQTDQEGDGLSVYDKDRMIRSSINSSAQKVPLTQCSPTRPSSIPPTVVPAIANEPRDLKPSVANASTCLPTQHLTSASTPQPTDQPAKPPTALPSAVQSIQPTRDPERKPTFVPLLRTRDPNRTVGSSTSANRRKALTPKQAPKSNRKQPSADSPTRPRSTTIRPLAHATSPTYVPENPTAQAIASSSTPTVEAAILTASCPYTSPTDVPCDQPTDPCSFPTESTVEPTFQAATIPTSTPTRVPAEPSARARPIRAQEGDIDRDCVVISNRLSFKSTIPNPTPAPTLVPSTFPTVLSLTICEPSTCSPTRKPQRPAKPRVLIPTDLPTFVPLLAYSLCDQPTAIPSLPTHSSIARRKPPRPPKPRLTRPTVQPTGMTTPTPTLLLSHSTTQPTTSPMILYSAILLALLPSYRRSDMIQRFDEAYYPCSHQTSYA